MNRIALSLLVVAASGAYVWDQSRQQEATDPLNAMSNEVAPVSEPLTVDSEADPDGVAAVGDTAAVTVCAPIEPEAAPAELPAALLPRPEITNAAMTTAATQGLTDGTYTGPTTDAYYGPMQIEAVVQGGRLVTLRALQYPSDRRTSLIINRQALPMLRDEAIAAQSADVDIITGATLTSEAFIRSLGGALAQAGR